jgi:hypothetical protein
MIKASTNFSISGSNTNKLRNTVVALKIRTAIREEPIKLEQYLRDEKERYVPVKCLL